MGARAPTYEGDSGYFPIDGRLLGLVRHLERRVSRIERRDCASLGTEEHGGITAAERQKGRFSRARASGNLVVYSLLQDLGTRKSLAFPIDKNVRKLVDRITTALGAPLTACVSQKTRCNH